MHIFFVLNDRKLSYNHKVRWEWWNRTHHTCKQNLTIADDAVPIKITSAHAIWNFYVGRFSYVMFSKMCHSVGDGHP